MSLAQKRDVEPGSRLENRADGRAGGRADGRSKSWIDGRARSSVAAVDATATISDALAQLRQTGMRSAVVLQNGEPVGFLTPQPIDLPFQPETHAGLEAELRMAKAIQQRLLPRALPSIPGLEVFGTVISARAVGGDYWSVKYYKSDARATMKLADVTGHGIASALLVPAVKFVSGGFYRGASSPEWVMEHTNHVLVKETPVEILVSMVYAWYEVGSRQLRVVNAGHRPVFIVTRSGVEEITPTGPLLGVLEGQYSCFSTRLEPDDLFVTCSDGITEAQASAGGERFGDDRVMNIAGALRGVRAADVARAVLRDCEQFSGPAVDDRSILVARAVP